MEMKRPLTILAFLLLAGSVRGADAEAPAKKYRIMMTAPPGVGSPNPLFAEPCQWPVLRDALDGYKYYGRQFVSPKQYTLDPKAFARFTRKAKFTVGVEFGHIFLPPKGTKIEPWRYWLNEAVAEIRPVFDAGGRVDTVHVDGPIRRILGHGGGGGIPQRSLPYDEGVDQFVKFWVALEKQYPGIKIGYLVNFPNWDYTDDFHGMVGHLTDKTGKTFHEILSAFHKKLAAAGGTIAFVEVDCPYMYYVAKQTIHKDAAVDNPGKIRALKRWCDARDIKLHMIVNEQCLSHRAKNTTPKQIEDNTKRFRDNTLRFVQSLRDDGIRPDVFLIQSWYGVPKRHIPETEPLTMTNITLQAVRKIHECLGPP